MATIKNSLLLAVCLADPVTTDWLVVREAAQISPVGEMTAGVDQAGADRAA
jgi:hypothetical protein